MIVFLSLTLIAVFIQGIFTLFEMACVSFNRIRLQYYVSLGKKRALWLEFLLKRPSRLFGTTLIGINAALQIGSECSRRFYESIHLDPDWAPFTQFLVVVVLAELAPLFTAMRYPEQVAMTIAPLMMVLARLLTPIIWTFDALSRLVHWIIGKPVDAPLFLSREEVKLAFEREEGGDEFNQIASRIFQLKTRTAGQLMTPLSRVQTAPSTATLADVRHLLSVHYSPSLLIYHRYPHNVVGLVYLRDLLRIQDNQKILDQARSPWFVTQDASILQILEQFRRNNQSVAVILDISGQASGVLTLDMIISQIFGTEGDPLSASSVQIPSFRIERTLSGEMDVSAFNLEFQADLPFVLGDTLSDLMIKTLNHPPAKGEAVRIGPYLFTVLEVSLRGIKTLSVHS